MIGDPSFSIASAAAEVSTRNLIVLFHACLKLCRRKHLLLALLQSGTPSHINVDPLSFSALSSVHWKLSCLTLPIVNVNTLPSHCHYAPLIRLRHTALYKCVFDLIQIFRLRDAIHSSYAHRINGMKRKDKFIEKFMASQILLDYFAIQ